MSKNHVYDLLTKTRTLCGRNAPSGTYTIDAAFHEASQVNCLDCLREVSHVTQRWLETARLVEEKVRVGHLAEELVYDDTYRAYCGVVAGFSEPVWAVDTLCTELREYDLSKLTCVDCASWYVTHAEAQLSDFFDKIKEAKAFIKKAGAK